MNQGLHFRVQGLEFLSQQLFRSVRHSSLSRNCPSKFSFDLALSAPCRPARNPQVNPRTQCMCLLRRFSFSSYQFQKCVSLSPLKPSTKSSYVRWLHPALNVHSFKPIRKRVALRLRRTILVKTALLTHCSAATPVEAYPQRSHHDMLP